MNSGWSDSAEAWVEAMSGGGDWARLAVLDRVMLDLATQRSPASALDIGCGEGRFCRLLASAGVDATGIDPTTVLVKAAWQRHPKGRYLVGSAGNLPFEDKSFDLVVSYLSLVDIEQLASAVSEMTRVLTPGGRLVIANLASHNTAGHWLNNDCGEPQGYLIDHYLEQRMVPQRWKEIDISNWHRPLSTYMKEFLANGLRLTFFDEPKPRETDDDPTGGKFVRAPWFVVMEWLKE